MNIKKFQELKSHLGSEELMEQAELMFGNFDVEDEEALLEIKTEYSQIGLFLCLYSNYTFQIKKEGHQSYQEQYTNMDNLFQNHKLLVSLMKKYIEIDGDIKDSFLDILTGFKIVGESCYECGGSGVSDEDDCYECNGTGNSLDDFIIEDLDVLDENIADLLPDLNKEIESFLRSI